MDENGRDGSGWGRILNRPMSTHPAARRRRRDLFDEIRGGFICFGILALGLLATRGCSHEASGSGPARVLAAELQQGCQHLTNATYFDTSDDDAIDIYVHADPLSFSCPDEPGWHFKRVWYGREIGPDNDPWPLRDGWWDWPLAQPPLCVPPIHLYLPTVQNPGLVTPTPAPTNPPAPLPTVPHLINVNTASLEELDTLPDVGPVIAQRIIDARPLVSCQDMDDRVQGLGPASMAKICPLITF